jgi:hypothetical protein
MTPVQRIGAATVLAGGACVIAAALMFSVPLGLFVAGVLFALLGSAVLRGAKR